MTGVVTSGTCTPGAESLGVAENEMVRVINYYPDGTVRETLYGGAQEELYSFERRSTTVELLMMVEFFQDLSH